MGTILAFRRSEEAAIPIAKPATSSLGEIIIFPGVRIERRRAGAKTRFARPQEVGRSGSQPDLL